MTKLCALYQCLFFLIPIDAAETRVLEMFVKHRDFAFSFSDALATLFCLDRVLEIKTKCKLLRLWVEELYQHFPRTYQIIFWKILVMYSFSYIQKPLNDVESRTKFIDINIRILWKRKRKKRNYHMIVKVSYKFMIFELFKLSLGILLYSSSWISIKLGQFLVAQGYVSGS